MNGVIFMMKQRYKQLMTAILTKQNARDKAFVGGNSGSSTNGEFEKLHVSGDATIDGKIENEQITNFETRIKTLEDMPADGLPFEDGLDDFIINVDTLRTYETDEYNILEIAFDDATYYEGEAEPPFASQNVFELIFPTSMNLANGIISVVNNKFNNPCITYEETYLMSYINDDDKPRLYMSKHIIDKPLDLFTSGFIRINYVAKTKQNVNTRDNKLINFKCNQIDADNCFKLYRSPLPDFYEMKSYGITSNKDYYFADYGYIPGSPEFVALIDGQTFEFHDEAFGTDYKMTKSGDKWIGNNVSYHIPISSMIKGETKFSKHQTQAIFIKQNETNKSILRSWIGYYSDENPFKIINEKGYIKFVDCELDKYDSKDGYWAMYLKCTQKKSCNFYCSLMINGIEYQTEFGFEYASYEAESCYKVNNENCYEYLPYHHNGYIEIGNPPYGLRLYMPTDRELIFKIADINYEEGMNTFEFLASTGYYTVSPRPEACTTLFTNYNIQTSGVVIGENIESHVFVLNSLGNTVDIAVNHISEIQNYCVQLQQQIEDIRSKQNWFDIVKDVVCISGSVINFMGGPMRLLSIAQKGITNLIGVSFAADEELLEEAAIIACDRASTVLAEIKVEELEMTSEEPLLEENLNRYRYLCLSLKKDYHIDVSFEIPVDNEKEVIRNVKNTYNVNDDLSITNISEDDSIQCRIIYENPYLTIDSNYKPVLVENKRIPKSSSSLELGLGENLKDNHILSSAATVKLIENHKNNMLTSINTQMSDYALKTDIPTIPDDLINETTLTTKLNDYALKTDIKELPNDLINETTLTTKLNDYALKEDIPLEVDLSEYRKYNDMKYKIIQPYKKDNFGYHIDIPGTDTLENFHLIGSYLYNNETETREFDIIFTIQGTFRYNADYYYCFLEKVGDENIYLKYNTRSGYVREIQAGDNGITKNYKTSLSLAEKIVVDDELALKSQIPTIPNDLINETALTTKLNNYVSTTRLNQELITIKNKYVQQPTIENVLTYYDKYSSGSPYDIGLKYMHHITINNIEVYIVLNEAEYPNIQSINMTVGRDTTFNIELDVNNESGTLICDEFDLNISLTGYVKNDFADKKSRFVFENVDSFNEESENFYPIDDNYSRLTKEEVIRFYAIENYNYNDRFAHNLGCLLKIASNESIAHKTNATITHYCPIEETINNINDFTIGGPIYMSGKVYKHTNDGWQTSTSNDTTDCICSVKASGKWNEYVGICVSIDEHNKCITFATHGDYLVKVNDTSCYSIGDEIFIDDDNVLKILSGNTAITSKIQRTTIGLITSKIDEKFLSVFKS